MQIIDLDVNIKETAVHHPNVIEKYLVVLMEIDFSMRKMSDTQVEINGRTSDL